MLVAELELYLSRPLAPTRRVALGDADLPVDPAPGHGGLLLAAIVADNIEAVDVDLHADIHRLGRQLEFGSRIAQPRLRHRFQKDRIGLNAHRHRLHVRGGGLSFDLDQDGRAAPHVLGALYAAGRLPVDARRAVFPLLRRALTWRGPVDAGFVAHLEGSGPGAVAALGGIASRSWALAELGLSEDRSEPDQVRHRFRELLRLAHPDHGGCAVSAAGRIDDLSRARRILLAD